MSSKVNRKQSSRQSQQQAANAVLLDPEYVAKRTKKHLEELERSNYTEAKDNFPGVIDDGEEGKATNRARETISLRSDGKKKKSTANVRSILLYRKNLNTLLDESGLANAPGPNYFTAVAPPPKYQARPLCQVCGYWGDYKCLKCGQPYCKLACREIHNETGCERRLVA